MSAPVTRRGMLSAGSATLLAVDLVGSGALLGAIAEHAKDIDHPDAALIRMCEQHITNLQVFNDSEESPCGRCGPTPLWDAYTATLDTITAAKPQTIAGMVAIARAAMAEARYEGNLEDDRTYHSVDEHLAWNLVDDLLRLHGGLGVTP